MDGKRRSGSASYAGGTYSQSGRTCGSPSGLSRRTLLSISSSSKRPTGSLDQGSMERSSIRSLLAKLTPMAEYGTMRVKSGLAEMLKGGVIMDVVDAEQAKIAEDAGACAVM